MGILNFKDFQQINERLGVAEATLFYTDVIEETTIYHIRDFISSEDKTYFETIEIPYRRFYKKIKDRNLYAKFPVVKIMLNLEFEKISNYKFSNTYKKSVLSKKKHAVGGWASPFGHSNWKGYSKITSPIKTITDHGIVIDIGLDITITDDYNIGSYMGKLSDDINEAVWHELNHTYEYYQRLLTGKGPIYRRSPRLAITHADINRWKISKNIYKYWSDNFSNFLYLSEKHEMSAQIQEASYFVSKYGIDRLYKTSAWTNAKYMESFDPHEFIENMEEIISNEGKDIYRTKESLKTMWLSQYRNYVEKEKEEHSINDKVVEKITFDEFVIMMSKRLNGAGRYMRKKLGKLYEFDPEVRNKEKEPDPIGDYLKYRNDN